MAKIDRETVSDVETGPGFEARLHDLGGYTVSFEKYAEESDPGPLFAGLPDDHCQCPHWGYVLEGRLTYRYSDGTSEVIGAGEAYYVPPGHLPLFHAGTSIVEFSPTDLFTETVKVVVGNLEWSQA